MLVCRGRWDATLGVAMLMLLLTAPGQAAPQYPVEEYFIEHEISSTQARNAVLHIHIAPTSGAGCKECTQQEIRYCLGPQLINDHCCCDRRYQENFPFVPHTCYLGEKLCEPLAKDCGEYSRLRTCCCDKYVFEKWKAKSKGRILAASTTLILSLFLLPRI